MLDITKKLFDNWLSLDINYCHWKSNEHIIPGLCGDTDLDVLVAIQDKPKCEASLMSLDFLKCKSQFGSRYPNVDDWIGFDSKTGIQIHVHLHYKIVTGHTGMKEYDLPWTELALSSRILDHVTGIYIMEPNLELLTLYTRIGLKASVKKKKMANKGKYHVDEDTQKEILYLKQQVSDEKLSALTRMYYKHNASALLELIKKQDLSSRDFLSLVAITEEEMQEHNRLGRLSTIYRYYYPLMLRFRSFLKLKKEINLITRKVPISEKGLVIAFIGQDGSGKSTVTGVVEKWLTWKMDAKRFYLGSGEHYNSWQKRWLYNLPEKKNPIQTLLSAFLVLAMYVDLSKCVLSTIKKGNKYASKGGIALFDRYPQNMVAGINDGPKIRANYLQRVNNVFVRSIASLFARIEERNIARASLINPDIVFKLMLPPEESLRRKPEESLESVSKKHDIIKNLSFNIADVYEIDATQPFEQEICEIKNIIWQHIQK